MQTACQCRDSVTGFNIRHGHPDWPLKWPAQNPKRILACHFVITLWQLMVYKPTVVALLTQSDDRLSWYGDCTLRMVSHTIG